MDPSSLLVYFATENESGKAAINFGTATKREIALSPLDPSSLLVYFATENESGKAAINFGTATKREIALSPLDPSSLLVYFATENESGKAAINFGTATKREIALSPLDPSSLLVYFATVVCFAITNLSGTNLGARSAAVGREPGWLEPQAKTGLVFATASKGEILLSPLQTPSPLLVSLVI